MFVLMGTTLVLRQGERWQNVMKTDSGTIRVGFLCRLRSPDEWEIHLAFQSKQNKQLFYILAGGV